jgi:flavodoxin I
MSELFIEVTESNFKDKVLDSRKPALVDFWASWCGPCQTMATVISSIALQFGDEITFTKCNVDENQNLVNQYDIQSMPRMLIFDNGKIVVSIEGMVSQQSIAERIENVLAAKHPAAADSEVKKSPKRTLIVYSSHSGNTKKLAETVNGLIGEEKTLCSINDAPEPDGFDMVALGFWLMAGKPDPTSAEYLKKIRDSKLFLFSTHGAAAGSEHALKAMEFAKSMVPSAQIVGTFECQGEVNPEFLEKASKKNPAPPWIKDAPDAIGHPDDSDLAALIETLRASLPEFI